MLGLCGTVAGDAKLDGIACKLIASAFRRGTEPSVANGACAVALRRRIEIVDEGFSLQRRVQPCAGTPRNKFGLQDRLTVSKAKQCISFRYFPLESMSGYLFTATDSLYLDISWQFAESESHPAM